MQKDVILVTVEYRVNVFGFLAHPWLMRKMTEQRDGGILDELY